MNYRCLEEQIETVWSEILTHEPIDVYLVPVGRNRWELRFQEVAGSSLVGAFKRPINPDDFREAVFETLHTMRPG